MTRLIKNFLFCIVVASLSAQARTLPEHPFIHASGHASMRIAPDMAELEFDVRAISAAPKESLTLLDGYTAEVRAFLLDAGIAEADMEVVEFKKIVSSDEAVADENAPKRFRLLRALRVVVRNLQNWELIANGLLQKEFLGNFSVNFGRSDVENIHADLIAKAAGDARLNATRLAQGFGVKLGAPSAISPSLLKNITTTFGLAGGTQNESQVTVKSSTRNLTAPLTVQFAQNLDVIFKIK